MTSKFTFKKELLSVVFFMLGSIVLLAQKNSITITADLYPKKDLLKIEQKIVFHNTSNDTLREIYLHNWANSYKDRNTPLSKRFIQDYNRALYFAEAKDLGYSEVARIRINGRAITYQEVKNQSDIIKINAFIPLLPKESITIELSYTVKIPNEKFTGYGKTGNGYNLRYWYITPAVYKDGWEIMSNLNTDDLFENSTDFEIQIKVPKPLKLESNLYKYDINKANKREYFLVGKSEIDVVMVIDSIKKFKEFNTKNILIHTNVIEKKINNKLATDILYRELLFIEKFLGKYPNKKIFIDEASQRKNPIYGLNRLPDFLSPFEVNFKWDLTMFKELSSKYIENNLLLNKRTDYWLIDGIQTYLMMKYVDEYYPEVKLFGRYAEYWGFRSFNVSQLKFNDKYPFVYRFSARQFLDQALTTRADSLSNFNRKIVNKYKAGLGLRYLAGYVGDSVLHHSIKDYFQQSKQKTTSSNLFAKILAQKTTKDIDWFFGDYINTNKKIDYTINKAKIIGDSIEVTLKNKRNITAPVALYGIKKDTIVFKKWVTNVDSTKTIKVKKGNYNRFILNYEQLYPEYNYLNNSKNVTGRVLNKPLKFTLFKDIESPNYHQIFYEPSFEYNYYDGAILGVKLSNKPIFQKNFELQLSPAFATKSNSLAGSFSVVYNQFFENSKIYNIAYGLAGGSRHYEPELSYNTLIPFVKVDFARKSLRDVGSRTLLAKIVNIDKEIGPGMLRSPEDKYHVTSLSYFYNKPNLIERIRYKINAEYATDFSKLSAEFRYRKLTATNRQLEFRVFAGAFIQNNSDSDYFSFGLDRANDYLFQLNYFGRSEETGIFSQQFIAAEGGFKSILSTRFANQYIVSTNTNVGIWNWLEVYNDAAILKNKGKNHFFAYENGFRLNFIEDIFEFYLPVYSNNGLELTQAAYPSKIRFVVTTNFSTIYNFIRRGFF